MDFRSQAALFAALVALAASIGVMIKPWRGKVHMRFAILGLDIFVWRAAEFLFQVSSNDLFLRLELAAGLAIPVTALRFFLTFLGERTRDHKKIAAFFYIFSALGAFLALFTNSFHFPITRALAISYVYIAFAICLFIIHRRYSVIRGTLEGTRLKYLFVGAIITIGMALLDLLPHVGIDYPPIGNLTIIIYFYFLYQTVVLRRLLDLNEFLGKGVVLGILSILFGCLYALMWLWAGRDVGAFLINAMAASLLLILAVAPLRGRVEDTVFKIMFRERYEFSRQLAVVRRELTKVIDLDTMALKVLNFLESSHRATSGSIYVMSEDLRGYYRAGHFGDAVPARLEIAEERTTIERLRKQGEAIVQENITREIEEIESHPKRYEMGRQETERLREILECLEKFSASLIIPFRSEEALLGFMALDDARLREAYSSDEIEQLLNVASQITTTIENSNLYERMKERDRLAALGEMSAGLAHEIRNPLGAIKGAAQYLSVEDMDPEDREFIDIIIEEVNRLNSVVSQFLEYARPYAGDPSPLDLNEVVLKTAQLISADYQPSDCSLKLELTEDLPKVLADAQSLKQVFLNLTRNAFEAMPDGGTLRIITRPATMVNKEAGVEISFKDSGMGMSAKVQKNIFIPFYTTKEKGSGLGLAICRRIVEHNGGSIHITSKKGRGTTITIRLPLNKETEDES